MGDQVDHHLARCPIQWDHQTAGSFHNQIVGTILGK
jgi:hypothetical protein